MGFRKLTTSELSRLSVDTFRQADKIPVVIVLDNVRSMNNVGSIFRSADAFLVEGLLLCGYTPKPPHRDIQKTALGATETVKWEQASDVREALEGFRARGYRVCAVEQAMGSTPLQEWKPGREEKWAMVLGNEVDGVQDSVLEICDMVLEIPQGGMKHSLNISVAAGIVMWQAYAQYQMSL